MRALQVSDSQGAMPSDWPNNELIGDQVIVPPASDHETAAKRLEEYQGYDWWFCYKPLEEPPEAPEYWEAQAGWGAWPLNDGAFGSRDPG